MKYQFEVLNAKDFYKTSLYDHCPSVLTFACAKHGFKVTVVPMVGHNPRLEIEGEPKEVWNKTRRLNFEFGIRLRETGEKLPLGPMIPREILRELHDEYNTGMSELFTPQAFELHGAGIDHGTEPT
jgi:hypothetical protein